ncbi:MAG: stage III sporulation protein AD [Bacillota bacterium]|nr:stage III sporulation protein AD [Bacillota bacterium]
MEITKIIAIGLIGTVFAVLLKRENPQLALLTAGAAGILIFLRLCQPLGELLLLLRKTAEEAGVSAGYFSVVLKVIGIAYLTQFGAQLCADAGEGAVAAKIELAGKVMMMTAAAPVLTGLLEMVMGLV